MNSPGLLAACGGGVGAGLADAGDWNIFVKLPGSERTGGGDEDGVPRAGVWAWNMRVNSPGSLETGGAGGGGV